jgi:xanthine dehydrogenase accessory factor
MDQATFDQVRFALETGTVQYFQAENAVNVLIEPYFPRPSLVVLGGGDIAKTLAEFGAKTGFVVTVVDDRSLFANRDQFDLNEYSFVVIVTRENRHDLDCLKQVLKHKTAYTGMIGSKRSVDRVKEQLVKDGYSEELVNQVNAPIGLDIGAITPEEIAVSIIAQAISYRRQKSMSANGTDSAKTNWPELHRSLLEELCKDSIDQKALITIIETKGSVPRKAGTQMLAWTYGMTMGSIGGGYAEGEVINAAWQVTGSGGLMIHDIEMIGQAAEEEGMVCGGVMRALIEDYS